MQAMTLLLGIQKSPLLFAVALGLIIALAAIAFLSFRVSRLTRGSDGKSLEGVMRNLSTRVLTLESFSRDTRETLKDNERRLQRSIQGVSVMRFDPFQNAGGQQSFSTALLDEKGTGVVISGIHGRDNVRVYAKDVSNFKSERELSDEERSAIEEVKKNLKV